MNPTVEQWFSEGFLKSNFYLFWCTMFAFQQWHSVLEMKLYMHRFLHLMDGLNDLTALVFPKYNQYDSFVRPLMLWLRDKGVNVQYDTIVVDIDMDISGETKTATTLQCHTGLGNKSISIRAEDSVFVTLGSMVEDTAYGDDHTVPQPSIEEPGLSVGASWRLW